MPICKMPTWLFSLIALSLTVLLLFGVYSLSRNGGDTNKSRVVNSSGICHTEECNQVSDAFINSMNQSIDPCVNFYEYVCGNWLSSNPLPVGTSELLWTAIAQFTRLAHYRLRGLFESEPSAKDILPIKQMKEMYKSCMNASGGIETIMKVFHETNGWPMSMNHVTWNRGVMTWQEIDHYYEHLLGYSTFWNIEVRNSSKGYGELVIQPPILVENYLTSTGMDIYRSVLKNLAQLLIKENSASVSDDQLEEDIDDVLNFEKALHKTMQNNISIASYTNVSSFVKDWNTKAKSNTTQGKIDWQKIFGGLLNIANLLMADETPISLENALYFYQLDRLLESTDERTIVNFMHWRFLQFVSPFSTMEIMNIWLPLSAIITNGRFQEPRWLRCIQPNDFVTIRLFGEGFKANTTKINTMITNIRKSFELQSAKSNWLSIEAKEAIKEKLNRMKYQVGYPEWYDDDTALTNFYDGLIIGDSYLENMFSLIKTYWTSGIRSWGKAIKYGVWGLPLMNANAFNVRANNTLTLPVVLFQPPLFRETLPQYVEYGTIGWMIGHELGHSVDTIGYQVGLKPNEKLFTDDITATFFEQTQCFVHAFDKYFNGTGNVTLPENIADSYGVQAAFDAYEEMRNKKYPDGELKLPKFDAFTDEKMFFISFAHGLCAASTKQIEDSAYSPNNLRVINTLSNTLAFAETFNCSKNAPMNPEEKCNIWMKPSVTP